MTVGPTNYQLILASASPRRQQFLRDLGLEFAIMVADIDETPAANEAPVVLAQRLATGKAHKVAARCPTDNQPRLVIAADTVVALGQTLLGKPADEREATTMLEMLCDRVHEVHTAISLIDVQQGVQRTRVNTTQVLMRNYTAAEIAAYVATGDPLDKAGAYAIQHRTFDPAQTINGCLSGVMGLPLGDLRDLLAEFGVTLPTAVPLACQRHSAFACCRAERVFSAQ